jgi:hypothetical protein
MRARRARLISQGGAAMRYVRIVLLLLAVTIGTQACIVPVPVGPGGGHRHHRHHHHHHDGWR